MIEAPPSFIVREECEKAASEHGFRRLRGTADGWAVFGSTTARGAICLAATGAQGPWFLALDHAGVIDELGVTPDDMPGPGRARYKFDTLTDLYEVMPRVYALSASLPDGPLREFEQKTRDLPQTTETERVVVQRIGQDIFRARLMEYWEERCPLTGISTPTLLRASHIIPWKDCPTDADRLNVHNGLLLSALWDAAFDRGLVTFNDDGTPEFTPDLCDAGRAELRWHSPLSLTSKHRAYLAWHRKRVFEATAPETNGRHS